MHILKDGFARLNETNNNMSIWYFCVVGSAKWFAIINSAANLFHGLYFITDVISVAIWVCVIFLAAVLILAYGCKL